MSRPSRTIALALAVLSVVPLATAASANAYREKDKVVDVAKATFRVTPARDWNQLSIRPGRYAEIWTLDGEQLNEVTFYGGVEPGRPLVRERSRKRDPLPRFSRSMLLAELPELLERTYRVNRRIGSFAITASEPTRFLGAAGVRFGYDYVDADQLPRRGEASAAVIGGRLYMMTFDAPRLHYFDRSLADYRALVASAALAGAG
jgi:hypothetical protein